MALLRRNEVREMGKGELKEKLNELEAELMSERAKVASGGLPDNPGKLNQIRKAIARIKTISEEKGYRI